jgi:hypothetical protein
MRLEKGRAARFSETGTGFAYAKLSGGQKPFPAARVARSVRMTSGLAMLAFTMTQILGGAGGFLVDAWGVV